MDMSHMDMSQLAPYLALVLAVSVWLALAVFSFWRNHRLSREVRSLRQMLAFFDALLLADRRHPVWVWPDGRVQAGPMSKQLLRLEGNIDTLDDLLGGEMCGLPGDTIERIRSGVTGSQSAQQPLVARYSPDARPVVIAVQRLATVSEDWPVCVLWVSESSVERGQGNWSGLQVLEDRLSEITSRINKLPFPVWVRGRDSKLIDVNDAYVTAVDGSDALTVVQRGRALFKEEAMRGAEKALSQNTQVSERHFTVISGQRRAFNVISVPLDSEHALSAALEVTGEEEALAELNRVLEAQSETLNRLRSPVAIFGPGKTLRFFNSSFARLTGLSQEWLAAGRGHGELLDAMRENRRLPEQANYRLWKETSLKQYTSLMAPQEEMWHLPDGSSHRVITQPHPLGGLLLLFEDLTDRLVLEQSYNTLIAVQQETLDNMKEGVAVFGTDGRLALSNPAFASLWQLRPNDITGHPHVKELSGRLQAEQGSGAGQDFCRDLPIWVSGRMGKSGRWHRSDGTVVDFSLVSLPDGGMLLTQVNMTDSFRIEQALRERSRALEVADRLKSQFITNMSYELRTPLNSIIGFAELLEQQLFGALNHSQMDYVRDILQAAGDLKAMISDVLDLAVIEAGEMSLDIENVDVVGVFNEATLLAQELAHKADIMLTVQVEDGVGCIMGDVRRLKQAFYNMVSAMLTLGNSSAILLVRLEEGPDHSLIVRVISDHCGLIGDERENFLSALALGGMPYGRRATGLDLALVRSIVKLHGGSVTLEAYEETGIVLVCRLPVTQKPTRVIEGSKAS